MTNGVSLATARVARRTGNIAPEAEMALRAGGGEMWEWKWEEEGEEEEDKLPLSTAGRWRQKKQDGGEGRWFPCTPVDFSPWGPS